MVRKPEYADNKSVDYERATFIISNQATASSKLWIKNNSHTIMELEHYILTVGGKTMKAFSRWLLVAILFSLILRSIGMNANTTTLALTILSIVYLGVYI